MTLWDISGQRVNKEMADYSKFLNNALFVGTASPGVLIFPSFHSHFLVDDELFTRVSYELGGRGRLIQNMLETFWGTARRRAGQRDQQNDMYDLGRGILKMAG